MTLFTEFNHTALEQAFIDFGRDKTINDHEYIIFRVPLEYSQKANEAKDTEYEMADGLVGKMQNVFVLLDESLSGKNSWKVSFMKNEEKIYETEGRLINEEEKQKLKNVA